MIVADLHVADLRVDVGVQPPNDLRTVALGPVEQRLVDPALRELPERKRARLGLFARLGEGLLGARRALAAVDQSPQLLVFVARGLDAEGGVGPDRDLLALAVQVVLEAPDLGAGGQHLEQQAAAIGEREGLLARLGVVDRGRLQDVVDLSHGWGHCLKTLGPSTTP